MTVGNVNGHWWLNRNSFGRFLVFWSEAPLCFLLCSLCNWKSGWGKKGSSRSLGVTLQQPNNRWVTFSTLNKLLEREFAVHVLVIWRKILSVLFSGVDSSSGIF